MSAPTFRNITAPLDITDAELDRLNGKLGVPKLVAAPEPDAPTKPQRSLNVLVPDYVLKAVKTRALERDCSLRHVVMSALAETGIAIEPADLVCDARRSKA